MFLSLLTGAVIGLTAGIVIATFWDEICDWVRRTFERIGNWLKNAQLWIKRIPGGIKQFFYYVKNGRVYEDSQPREVTDPDKLNEILGKMTPEERAKFNAGKEAHVGNVEREA